MSIGYMTEVRQRAITYQYYVGLTSPESPSRREGMSRRSLPFSPSIQHSAMSLAGASFMFINKC